MMNERPASEAGGSYATGEAGKAGMVAASAAGLPPRLRIRLAARIAWPPDQPSRRDARRLIWISSLAALPCLIWLGAPAAASNATDLFALLCTALPGIVAAAATAARAQAPRDLTMRALRQAGAPPKTAWLLASARTTLCAALGTLLGAAALATLSPLLDHMLPGASPLRAMLAVGSAGARIEAVAATTVLAVACALLAGTLAARMGRDLRNLMSLARSLPLVGDRWRSPTHEYHGAPDSG